MTSVMTDRGAVPGIMEQKGRELLADGVRLAHQLNGWVLDVDRLIQACSLLSQQDDLEVQEADALGMAWLDGSRASDLFTLARWMMGRIDALGTGIAAPLMPWQDLLCKIRAEVTYPVSYSEPEVTVQ